MATYRDGDRHNSFNETIYKELQKYVAAITAPLTAGGKVVY